jgi:hypothetical protein
VIPHTIQRVRRAQQCRGVFVEHHGGAAWFIRVSDSVADWESTAVGIDPELAGRDGVGECGHRAGGDGRGGKFLCGQHDGCDRGHQRVRCASWERRIELLHSGTVRVVDTRNPAGTFGGPVMSGGTTRTFPLSEGTCGLPATASAYLLKHDGASWDI